MKRHWVFAVFVVLYAALLLAHLDRGLASLDGHGIVRVTRHFVDHHQLEVSRPPGHPTTEIYLFPAAGWFLKLLSHSFDGRVYLVFQAFAALGTLILFYELVCRLGAARWRAMLVTVCLAFSAQYFSNAIDGEEFIFGLFFILLAVRFLIVPPEMPVPFHRLLLSISCFAFATGCRPELIFAAAIFPIYCLAHPKLSWKDAFITALIAAVAVLIVWLPILIIGLRAPYNAGMSFRESILAGGYKLIFQCFTVPVFGLFCWLLLTGIPQIRKRLRAPFPENFAFAMAVAIPLVFFVLFFRYATKPAFTLAAVPFLLLLAVDRSKTLLVTLTIATLFGSVVSIDIFRDRHLVHPFLIPGSYFQAVSAKPFYKVNYLRTLSRQCAGEPSIVIADAWPWDFEYHMARGNFAAREKLLTTPGEKDLPAFYLPENHNCIFLPREGALQTRRLKEWQSDGRTLKLDAAVYQAFFARYDTPPLSIHSVTAGDLSFSLFAADGN